MIKAYGFDYINLLDSIEEIGLNFKTDFSDTNHTNVHGALKMTNYLAGYLVDQYRFEDKRSDSKYADWEDAYQKYINIINTKVL